MTQTGYDPEVLEMVRKGAVNEMRIDGLLEEYLERFGKVIRHKKQRLYFRAYIKGLMSGIERKSVEPVALTQLGEKAVRPMQELLKRSTLNEAALHAVHVEGIAALAGGGEGMLSVDESDFPKKGKHSAGVKRQYCGRLGKTENCQAGAFAAYAGDNGYGLVDKALYIPAEWFDNDHKEMRQKCQIPDSQEFKTKNQMAQEMLNKAFKAGLNPEWVGMDAAFGCDHKLLDGLELPAGVYYFAATNAKERESILNHLLWSPLQRIAGEGHVSIHSCMVNRPACSPWPRTTPFLGRLSRSRKAPKGLSWLT